LQSGINPGVISAISQRIKLPGYRAKMPGLYAKGRTPANEVSEAEFREEMEKAIEEHVKQRLEKRVRGSIKRPAPAATNDSVRA